MNNLRWMSKLFNTRRNRQILKMFGRKRNNRGAIWASLLGIGASAAAYGIGRNRNNGMRNSIQNVFSASGLNNLKRTVPMPNKQVFAEFAEEMVPNQTAQPPVEEATKSKLD